MSVMPRSVKEALPKGAPPHSHAAKEYVLPDHLVQQFGNSLKIFIDPPRVPDSAVTVLDLLLAEHDRIMGHAEVLQGRTTSRAGSGKAVDLW